jgi:hypothetical protein
MDEIDDQASEVRLLLKIDAKSWGSESGFEKSTPILTRRSTLQRENQDLCSNELESEMNASM